MHVGLGAELFSRRGHDVAHREVVGVHDQVRDLADNVRVLLRLPREAEDVAVLLLYTAKGLGRTGNALHDHDSLHLWVVRKSGYLADDGLHLRAEVVRIGDVLYHAALGGVAVHRDELFRTADIILSLRDRSRNDADMKRRGGGCGEGVKQKQRR